VTLHGRLCRVAPPTALHNIQYIAAALAMLYFQQKIDGTDPQPAIEILTTSLPSASAEEVTFTFRVLQEQKAFSHGNGASLHGRKHTYRAGIPCQSSE
jgi:hypothetical protein